MVMKKWGGGGGGGGGCSPPSPPMDPPLHLEQPFAEIEIVGVARSVAAQQPQPCRPCTKRGLARRFGRICEFFACDMYTGASPAGGSGGSSTPLRSGTTANSVAV